MSELLNTLRFMRYIDLPIAGKADDIQQWITQLNQRMAKIETNLDSKSFKTAAIDKQSITRLNVIFSAAKLDNMLAITTLKKFNEIMQVEQELNQEALQSIAVASLATHYATSLKKMQMSIDAKEHAIELAWITLRAAIKAVAQKKKKDGQTFPAFALIEMLTVHADNMIGEVFELRNNRPPEENNIREMMYELVVEYYTSGRGGKTFPIVFADQFVHYSEIWLDEFWQETFNEALQPEYFNQLYLIFYQYIKQDLDILKSIIPDSLGSPTATIEAESAIFAAALDEDNPLGENVNLKNYLTTEIAAWSNAWRTFDSDKFGSIVGRYGGAMVAVMDRFQEMFVPSASEPKTKAVKKKPATKNTTAEKLKRIREKKKDPEQMQYTLLDTTIEDLQDVQSEL